MLNQYSVHIVLFLLLLSGCTGSQTLPDKRNIDDHLAPGLRVLYFDGMYRNVKQIPDGDRAILEKGRTGAPILVINNQFGQDEVFNSGRNRGVGVQMKGYLLLDQPGSYEFQALSNDGVEIIIDLKTVVLDPKVHSDRLSKVGAFSVQAPGYHSLMVKYFQRKGTAALKLFWKTPGVDDFEIIPARAYGHLPDNPKTE